MINVEVQEMMKYSRYQPHLLIPSAQTINQKKSKEPRNETQLPKNPIILP